MKNKNVVRHYDIYTPDKNDGYVDAITQLQSNIELASIEKKYQVIGITSALASEGKSTLAANLAHVYALKGFKTIIIDLDLRKPTVHRYYKVTKENGVVEYCLGKITKEEVIKHSEFNVDVITAGQNTMFPIQILESEVLKNLINELRKEYDYVIVDNPPVLAVTDAIVSAKLVDGYVLAVRQNQSKASELKDALKIINDNNVNIIGCALTDIKSKGRYYNYYYYHSYK